MRSTFVPAALCVALAVTVHAEEPAVNPMKGALESKLGITVATNNRGRVAIESVAHSSPAGVRGL